jgi:hypothetical protein
MKNTATAPNRRTTIAAIAATAPLDILRVVFTGIEIGEAALILALTAEGGAFGWDG